MIKREIYKDIQEHLSKKEITLVIGPRQIGKSTLLKWLKKELDEKKIPTLFFNLDVERDNLEFASQEKLITRIKLAFGKRYGVVFIDEFQRKSDAGIFLKGIYDLDIGVKLVVSGSGSLELKEKIAESLVGRKKVFEILPVSFLEFLDYKTNYQYADRLSDYLKIEVNHSLDLLAEYMLYGAYPAVITASNSTEKRDMLAEIVQSYLYKDAQLLLSINHIKAYSKLINVLSQQVGYPINYHQLSQYINVSANTVKDYLWYLDKTFIIRESLPYFTNSLKEIVKSPCSYFVDLGFCNFLRNNLFEDIDTPAFGFVFQNLVYNTLYDIFRRDHVTLKFWRTKDKAEVDIVIDYPGKLTPVEVKYSNIGKVEITRSLRSFINTYHPKSAFVITWSGNFETRIENTQVYGIPYFELLKIKQYI